MPTKTISRTKSTNHKKPTNPIVWVEIPVTDMERAKNFYQKVFDLKYKMHTSEEFLLALIEASPQSWGTGGALIKGPSYKPSYDGSLVYFTTPDIEGTLNKAVKAGGSICQNKKSIGEYGFVAYFEDCEGNRIGLHSMS